MITGEIHILSMYLPFAGEKKEIVRRVEALFAFADLIEARLTPATLAKAFRCELVPQAPNNEPASALLAHLCDSSQAHSNSRRRKLSI